MAKRRTILAEKRAKKKAAMKRPGGSSRYAIKKREQANGKYRPTSPFRLHETVVEVEAA